MPDFCLVDTAHGVAALIWADGGVCGFRLPAETAADADAAVRGRWPDARPEPADGTIAVLRDAVVRYFDGARVDFSTVGVVLGNQEPFFAQVYDHVRAIPWGESRTYGDVARRLGHGAEAARAVGQAMARNPIPLIIPCHRVLAAGGRVGGFTAPGGIDAKRRMLALEGISSGSTDPAQVSFTF